MESKSVWRLRCRQRRRLAWQLEAESWSKALASDAFSSPNGVLTAVLPPSPGLVAAYQSSGTEPPTNQLVTFLLTAGYQVLVPAPGPDHQRLAWVNIKIGDSPEPSSGIGRGPEILPGGAIERAKCILIPALAVDEAGNRLGQGGGWYDRILPLANPAAPRVAVVNPAELLPANSFPRLPHDQPMTHALLPGRLLALDSS